MNSEDILTLAPPPYDTRLRYGGDRNQFGELRLPKAKLERAEGGQSKVAGAGAGRRRESVAKKAPPLPPLVMVIHGGFWRARYDLLHAGHLCAALTAQGVATFNLEYRRVGNPGGGWPGTFEDVMAGYEFIRQQAKAHGIDGERAAVVGHSAGGELALALAAHQPKLAGAVSLAGVLDLERAWQLHLSDDAVAEFLGGTPAEVPEHYREASPMALSIPSVPQIVMAGAEDQIVPPDFSRDYAKAKRARGETVELLEIAGAGHFELIDPRSAAWPRVQRAILSAIGAVQFLV